jgi:ketosteroid isomerase-like protein
MDSTQERQPITEEEVRGTLQRMLEAYEEGRKEFFDWFAPDASLFVLSSPTRIDSREVYQQGFGQFFYETKRTSQILSPEYRILGDDGAVVSFHNRVLVGGVSTNLRGTIVFHRAPGGELKVVHMHNSPLGQPTAPGVALTPQEMDEVTVLEERVAAASAAVGTPK